MNHLNANEIRELVDSLPNRRILRTNSLDSFNIFFELDQDGNPRLTNNKSKTIDKSLCKYFNAEEELNKTLTSIEDPQERADAYKEIAEKLNEIIIAERRDNIKNLKENNKFIKEQCDENSILQTELDLLNEQLINTKELLNRTSNELITLKEIVSKTDKEDLIKNINTLKTKINRLKEENNLLKSENNLSRNENTFKDNTISELKNEVNELSKELSITRPNFYNIQQKSQADIPQNQPLQDPETDQLFEDFQNSIQNNPVTAGEQDKTMEITAKDVITAIPIFSGDMKNFDSFINTCGVYYEMVEAAQKPFVLKIIKAKIIGDALSKAGPFTDDLNTWDLLKQKLKTKLKKPISLEYAQEDLSNIFQKKDESIEDFGTRVKAKLKKLNEASALIAKTEAEKSIIRKMNEKQAISKFEQNLRNSTVKVLVSAASKQTLDECITFAMEKDLVEKNKNIKNCNICGMSNHDESTCRKKKNGNGNVNSNKNRNWNKFNKDGNKNNWQQTQDNNPDNSKPSTSFPHDRNQNKNENQWKNRGNNQNDQKSDRKFQRKIKKTQKERKESDDEMTVKEAMDLLEKESETKN